MRIAADFGLLTGGTVKEFASYHLPDESFLYLVYAVAQFEPNARRIIESPEWRLFLMDTMTSSASSCDSTSSTDFNTTPREASRASICRQTRRDPTHGSSSREH